VASFLEFLEVSVTYRIAAQAEGKTIDVNVLVFASCGGKFLIRSSSKVPFDAQVLHFPPEAQGKERFTRTSRSMKPTRIDYWRSRLNLTKTQIMASPSEEGLSTSQEALGRRSPKESN